LRVEEACQSAWPAQQQLRLGGWLLRLGGVLSRRANSANPLNPEPRGDSDLIRACEALYRRHRRPTIFRLPTMTATDLDERLAAAGYTAEGESCVPSTATSPVSGRRRTRRCGSPRARTGNGSRRWRRCKATPQSRASPTVAPSAR
jgi:hypothetical protein